MSQLVHFTEHGSGRPLLLIHGLMVTGEMFEPVVDQFAQRHRVIVPDLRGHGQSRALSPPYSVAQLASDLAVLLDHLDIAATSVLGYSQGGAVAQQLALDHPERVGRLVLACTYAFNMASIRERFEGHLAPLLIRTLGMQRFADLVVSRGARELAPQRGAWLASLIAKQEKSLMVRAWKEAMVFDSRRRLPDIQCPTLIVAGSRDSAVPMHHARMLHDGIRGSQLVVVENAGHTLIWTHPDDLVRATEAFLEA